MDAFATASFLIAIVCTIVAALFTFQLARGQWLLFVFGRAIFDEDPAKQEKARTIGKRMALVTGAFALLALTIVVYKAAELAGNGMLHTIGLYANNIAFLLFIAALIGFYAIQRYDKNREEKLSKVDSGDTSSAAARMARRAQKARVDSFPTATLIFLICIAAAAFALGLLFSSF